MIRVRTGVVQPPSTLLATPIIKGIPLAEATTVMKPELMIPRPTNPPLRWAFGCWASRLRRWFPRLLRSLLLRLREALRLPGVAHLSIVYGVRCSHHLRHPPGSGPREGPLYPVAGLYLLQAMLRTRAPRSGAAPLLRVVLPPRQARTRPTRSVLAPHLAPPQLRRTVASRHLSGTTFS